MMEYFNMPWKIGKFLKGLLCYPVVRMLFAINNIPWGHNWRFFGIPIIQKHRLSTICFGANLYWQSSQKSNNVGLNHPVFISTLQKGAELVVGDNFSMAGGSVIVAERIEIGNNVSFGPNLLLMDAEYHPLNPTERRTIPNKIESAPIIIEDDVYIGLNSLVLKGVRIGRGSVVGAGSIVTKNIPQGVIVAGNPARVVREIYA